MKKTLLSFAIALMSVSAITAQTVWNLGGDPTVATNGAAAWPVSTGLASGVLTGTTTSAGGTETINGLTITTGNIVTTTLCGVVSVSAKSFTSPTTNTSYSFANKFLLNGSGYSGAAATDATPSVNMPTQKYASFNVSGNSTIYMIGVTGSSTSSRKVFVTDGINYIGSVDFPGQASGTPPANEGTINYTGPATKLYLFCNASVALYYISATNVVIAGVSNVLADKGISFNGKEITNKNNLQIEVYNVLGKKIATSTTNIATANLQKGVYIVKAVGTSGSLKFNI